MLVFRDRLNRTNGGIGSNYTDSGAATSITSNAITFTSSVHAFYYDVATLADSGVYVQMRASAVPANPGFLGLYLITVVDSTDGYYVGIDSTGTTIFRVDNGSLTSLGTTSFTSPAAGDIVTLTYDGANVRLYYNGSLQQTRADATYAVSNWIPTWAGQNTDGTIDDLECGTLSLGTFTKSVGATGRDYATVKAWVDECPPYLTLSNTVYKGELYNDAEFSYDNYGGGTETCFWGYDTLTDSTRYFWLTPAAGEGYKDDPGAATAPLRYDQSKGVAMRVTGNYRGLLGQGNTLGYGVYLRIDGVQLFWDTTYSSAYYPPFASINIIMDGCIMEHRMNTGNLLRANGCVFKNSIFVARENYGGYMFRGSSEFHNCTIVSPSDAASAGGAFIDDTTYPLIKNCSAFGFSTFPFAGTIASYPAGCTNNAADCIAGRVPGSDPQEGLTYADQFEDVVLATRDWRPKSGSSLINNGVRDQTYTNDLDIVGISRSITTPTIGAREFSVGGGGGGGTPVVVAKLYANGQFSMNAVVESGGAGVPIKLYANGTTQILNMVEFIGPTKLYANGTFSTNSFAEF